MAVYVVAIKRVANQFGLVLAPCELAHSVFSTNQNRATCSTITIVTTFKLHCLFICLAVAVASVPTNALGWDDGEVEPGLIAERQSGPSTLFHWGIGERADEAEDEDPRLVTDRPHFSEASNLVGLGRVQIETGYSFFKDNDGGTKVRTHSFPEPLLRAGLFADWFEFRLGYNYLIQQSDTAVTGHTRLSGSDDLYVAAKLALTKQEGYLPEIALFPQLRVPSGSPAFSAGETLPGFNLAYSWKLNDVVELECNTQLNRRIDDVDHFYTEFIQTANLEYDLAPRIGAFTEWFCFVPSGAIDAHTQHYFHGGFVYFLTDNIQLDIHSAVGLSRRSNDLAFSGMGLSVRF